MADQVDEILDVPREFFKDGWQFINRCQKPDQKEFVKLCQAIAVGFGVMGAVGFIVKLIHIPINNILVAGA